MRFTKAYARSLEKAARSRTRRLLKCTPAGGTITLVVWGNLAQEAYLNIGWHPVSEAPRVDEPHRIAWTEMTMTLTKEK